MNTYKKILAFILVCLVLQPLSAQLYNNAHDLVITPNANVYVNTDFVNLKSGKLDLRGSIHVRGNWTNLADIPNIIDTGTGGIVHLCGVSQQLIGGNTGTIFRNLQLDNPFDVVLSKDATSSEILTFTQGKLITGTNWMIVQNHSNIAIHGYDQNKYIAGNLRRYISGTDNFDLPIGTISKYELACIKFNSYSGINYINAFFTISAVPPPAHWPDPSAIYVYPDIMNPVANPLSLNLSYFSYFWDFLDYGYWTIHPDAYTAANFKLFLTERGHSNGGLIPNQHAIAHRANSSSQWSVQGIFAQNSQNGTGSDPITASMDQMTSFSDFILGKSKNGMGPLAIVLTKFSATCLGNVVRINWTTSNETNNDFFTIEKSTDLVHWLEALKVNGSQTSQGDISYEAIDNQPLPGISYYRLKQTDIDGQEHIYDDQWVRFVNCNNIEPDDLHISLEQGTLNLILDANKGDVFEIGIFDILGRAINNKSGILIAGRNTLTISCGPVRGVYLLRFKRNSTIRSFKILN